MIKTFITVFLFILFSSNFECLQNCYFSIIFQRKLEYPFFIPESFYIFATAIRKEARHILLYSLTFTTTRKSKYLLMELPPMGADSLVYRYGLW